VAGVMSCVGKGEEGAGGQAGRGLQAADGAQALPQGAAMKAGLWVEGMRGEG